MICFDGTSSLTYNIMAPPKAFPSNLEGVPYLSIKKLPIWKTTVQLCFQNREDVEVKWYNGNVSKAHRKVLWKRVE